MDRLRDGMLSPAEASEIGRHAAECEACRKVVDSISAARMLRDLRIQIESEDPEHLSPDTLMACADAALTGEELAAANLHLQDCEICDAEVAELRRLKNTMHPRRRWVVYAVAATLAAVVVLVVPWLARRPDEPIPGPVRKTVAPVIRQPSPAPAAQAYERAEWTRWVAEARDQRALPIPQVIEGFRTQQAQLRGPSDSDDLALRPNLVVVANSRPRFQWARRDGASYKVILEIDGAVVESETLTEPQWTPPSDLKRGSEVDWQVEVAAGGKRSIYPKRPNPPARFRLLDQRAIAEINGALAGHPDDPLLHAVVQARYGLRQEALQSLDRLEGTDAALASALRESLRKWPL